MRAGALAKACGAAILRVAPTHREELRMNVEIRYCVQ